MDGYQIVICILISVVVILFLIRNSSTYVQEIPKTIWTYWDGSPPEIVEKCMATWRKHNPDYTINLLSNSNITDYLPETNISGMKMADTPQRKSDFIRIHILEKYGGVWCDASIIMTDSLEFIRTKSGYDLVGYHIGKMMNKPESPVIENWFIAAPPRSDFIRKWRDTFTKINEFKSPDDYVQSIRDSGVDISKVESPEYLTMHVASQHVIQKQMTPAEVSAKLYLMKAEDGPLKYMSENNWETTKGVSDLCNKKAEYNQSIIKLRGSERNVIEADPRFLNCILD